MYAVACNTKEKDAIETCAEFFYAYIPNAWYMVYEQNNPFLGIIPKMWTAAMSYGSRPQKQGKGYIYIKKLGFYVGETLLDTAEAKMKNGTELAFVGDAVFELLVREHISSTVDVNANTLHRMSVEYVCADGQSRALDYIMDRLDADELDIVRRGRNANKVAVPRNADPKAYRRSTALEALFGYLHLCGRQDRILQLFGMVVAFHDGMLKDEQNQ